METTATHTYAPPVDQLLKLGDCRRRDRPPYSVMGFGPEHVPELIRMSTDPALTWAASDSDEVWAPIHAWRVLGMLRAEEAIEPLLGCLEEDEDSDWALGELPRVFGQIGPPAVAPLLRYLEDRSHGTWARVGAASGLEKIGSGWPEVRDEVVAALARVLEDPAQEDEDVNGSIVSDLIDLKAVEAAPAMERAFAEGRVDPSVAGDWEDVQVEMGLLPARVTPYRHNIFGWTQPRRETLRIAPPRHVEARQAPKNAGKSAAKRKAEKAARRKNRRRK